MPAVIPAVAGLAGAAISAKGAKDAAKTAASATTTQQLHPQMDALLYGSPGQQGVISRAVGLLDRPQSAAMQQYGNAAGDYLTQYGANDMGAMRKAGYGLLDPISAPQASAAQWNGTPQMSAALTGAPSLSAGAPQVTAHGQGQVLWNKGESFNAPNPMQAAQASAAQVNMPQGMQASLANGVQMNSPAQNSIDLTGSFNRFVNGTPGANPYLDQSISGAIAMNRLGFNQLQDDATENLMKNVMPGIRSNSVLAGQYGGSRQGVAEGNAIGQLGKEMARAGSQFAQNATNAAVGAKANAYESDSNRALSATQSLSAQQYGAAQTNAGLAQQTNQFNAAQQQQANATNYGGLLSGAMANAGYGQQTNLANQAAQMQANSTNYAGQLAANQGNASLAQQANMANQQAGNNAAQFGAAASQAASLANAQLGQNNNQFNAGLLQNNSQFNASQQQNANQVNAGLLQQTGLANLGTQQQTNLANLQAQLGTNQLNSNNAMAGTSVLGGLLNTNYQTAGNQDSYDLNRMMNVGGLLSSFTNAGGSRVSSQPMYSNAGGAALGGGLAGFSLANQLGGLLGGGTSSQFAGERAGSFTDLGGLFGKGSYV